MTEPRVWHSNLTPLRFLERSANVFRDKPAVIYGDTRYTYPEMQRRVNRLASALIKAGVKKGDRVAILAPNVPAMLESHFGVPLAGAALVTINTRLSSEEIAYILNHSGARMLFVDSELGELVTPIRHRAEHLEKVINIVDMPGGQRVDGPDYEEFLAAGQEDPIPWPLEDEDEVISINYTSGTTGRPKGVMYTHRGAYLNALGQVLIQGVSSDTVFLWTVPMFHCNGWCFTWGVTAMGGTHVCLRKVDPPAIWRILRDERVTHFNGAPTVLISLIHHPAARDIKLDRKLRIVTAGAPPSPTTIAEMESLGGEITQVYGLTETYGPYTVCEWQSHWNGLSHTERARIKARQGVPHAMADDVRVVDENMQDVPADGQTIGEVVMRGNIVMKGYYNDPDATAEAFRGGWFHSGDLGVMHQDGYVELSDRKKDIIISGGENISTIEVERAIAEHPAVLEVAVIAVPHEHWGEVPKAFVVPKDGTNCTEEAIIEFCRGRIAHFKCPKAVQFGDLPKTSTGKVQKYVLREKEWAGHEKRIH